MIDLTLAEVADILSGTLILGSAAEKRGISGQTVVNGVVDTDSRNISSGAIFVAKPGEFTDGHLFVDSAVAQGAALVIAERELSIDIPHIIVPHSVEALGALATEVIRRVRLLGTLRIVAVTGSNGKTTTKNLLHAILDSHGRTCAARDSFNNEVGAPLTMLKVQADTEFLVLEMGASAEGEIARLVHMAHPDVGIVLNVGLAHAGVFGGIDATQRAKTEMVADLSERDLAVLNSDDFRVSQMAKKTAAQLLWFGFSERANVRATEITASSEGTRFRLTLPTGESQQVHFRVLGEHHVSNALAAAAAAYSLGVSCADIVAGLQSVTRAERWRMELFHGANGVTIINDAYNASPDSMAAALKTLAHMGASCSRTVAVLGEMSELGDYSLEEHDRVGRMIVRLGIHKLVVVGEAARAIHLAATHEGSWNGESVFCDTAEQAYQFLASELRSGDCVLLKSSNSAGLRFLGDSLVELFA